MIFGSVCSGIEAASAAWNPLGWRAAFVSEIAPAARAVLAHRHPDVPLHGDFTTIQAGDYEPIDLLVGGTPCQSFSVAGLRGGMADERGNLALEYLRLADRLRPRWLVWENVPGVLSSNGGRDFGSFLGGLGQLGYGFAYRVLDAQYFGLAQRRKRVFVVGHLGDWRRAAAVLFEPASLRGDSAPRRQAGEGVAGTVTARVDNGSRQAGANGNLTGTLLSNGKAAGSATSQDAENGFLIAHSLRGEGFDASEDGTGRGTPLVVIPVDTTQITSAGNYSRPQAGDPCYPLAAGAHPPAITLSAQMTMPTWQHDLSETLQAENPRAVAFGSAVRRLTPYECEKLQGFPPNYTLVPHRGKPMADSPRYKMLGNSMAVPVMHAIGQRIAAVEAQCTDESAASPGNREGGREPPEFGAQGRSRTTDTAIFSRMLYQLSYLGISGPTGRVI